MIKGLVLVSNIPSDYHTADLRRFFSDYVEQNKLACFHYRHRPDISSPSSLAAKTGDDAGESSEIEKQTTTTAGSSKSFSKTVTSRVHVTRDAAPPDRPACCCLVHVEQGVDQFIASFHLQHWLDSKDSELETKCFISKVTEEDQRGLLGLPELRPPNVMPRGNVGTSTQFFLDAIRDCRLPAKLIGKLRLEFPKTRLHRYGSVPFQYEETSGRTLKTIDRDKLKKLNAAGPSFDQPKDGSDPEDDDDTCEEWERHEALHNDVQPNRAMGHQVQSRSYLAADGDLEQQPGTKEALYEGEIEQVWEKGGSGLNWWTDTQYWKAQEGDFDEQTTDDWDVDMSVYYEKDAGHDMDAADRFSMRESEFLRTGQHIESVFRKPRPLNAGQKRYRGGKVVVGGKRPMGRGGGKPPGFQAHSSGFGARMMKESGWQEGSGLGPTGSGIKDPLDGEEEGQPARDRSGLGYREQKIVFTSTSSQGGSSSSSSPASWIPPPPPGSRITTAYSGPGERDPGERLDRSNPPLYLKFRNQAVKFHSGGVTGGTYNPLLSKKAAKEKEKEQELLKEPNEVKLSWDS